MNLQQLKQQWSAWQDKLHYFQMERVKINDIGQKFQLEQQIKETKQEIQNLDQQIAEQLSPQLDQCDTVAVDSILSDLEQSLQTAPAPTSDEQQALLEQILAHLQAVDKTATAKLKIILPIIPMFLHYDLELDSESGLAKFWQRAKNTLFRQK